MAKIVCITSGLTGILNASFELMERLKSEGHEVICAVPQDVSEKVNRQGFEFEELPSIDFSPVLNEEKKVLSRRAKIIWKYKNIKSRRIKLLDQIYPDKYVTLLERLKPDLVLLDIELHEFIIVTAKTKVPFVLLSQWFSVWERPGLPYLKLETIPGQGWKGSAIGIWLSWRKVQIQRWLRFSKKKIKTGLTDRRSLLLALARQQNFPRKYIGKNLWPGPFLYNELPVLNLVQEQLELPHKKRVNSFYVGAMVNDKRKDLPARTINDYTVTDVFSYAEEHQAKLIYCSLSTMKRGDTAFLDKVIAAVKAVNNWVLIISTGKLIKESVLGHRPENVFTFSFVPQIEVLSKADCSINHGGIHTINECIHFGVPMLVYSGKKADQNGCAARVAYHQIGLLGDKDVDGVGEISKKIDEVLTKELYRKNMKKLQKAYFQDQETKLLEKTINSFLLNAQKS